MVIDLFKRFGCMKCLFLHFFISSKYGFHVERMIANFCEMPRIICVDFSRLVPHVDKAPLPLRILRLVTSNFLPVENPTHPTAHAPERASVYILGQFRTSK